MSFLKNLKKKNDIVGTDSDLIGGVVKSFVGGVYDATIEKAYIVVSSGGAVGIYLGLDLVNAEQQGKYSETVYITSREGNNFYVDKRTNKKRYLPGFTMMDSLARIVVGKEIADLTEEMRIVNVYDTDLGKEVPKQMPTLVELIGRSFKVGLQQIKVNKEKKTITVFMPLQLKPRLLMQLIKFSLKRVTPSQNWKLIKEILILCLFKHGKRISQILL